MGLSSLGSQAYCRLVGSEALKAKSEPRLALPLRQEYVALTTAAYRQAIDRAWDSTTEWEETPAAQLLAEPETARTALAQLFARGQDLSSRGKTLENHGKPTKTNPK